MLVRQGDRTILEIRAKAEPAADVMTADYYTQLPQIRLTANPTSRERLPEVPADVTLDDTDVAKLVECAVRHPVLSMRYAVLSAIWNHPDSFRQIFQFGLNVSRDFPEIHKIVAEELDKHSLTPRSPAKPAAETLLPRMPLPKHLQDREKQ